MRRWPTAARESLSRRQPARHPLFVRAVPRAELGLDEMFFPSHDRVIFECQERGDDRSRDSRDQEAPEEVVADRVAFDERDDVNTIDDVDRQGRRGQEERDWWGDMYADSGRGRPNDGTRRRR